MDKLIRSFLDACGHAARTVPDPGSRRSISWILTPSPTVDARRETAGTFGRGNSHAGQGLEAGPGSAEPVRQEPTTAEYGSAVRCRANAPGLAASGASSRFLGRASSIRVAMAIRASEVQPGMLQLFLPHTRHPSVRGSGYRRRANVAGSHARALLERKRAARGNSVRTRRVHFDFRDERSVGAYRWRGAQSGRLARRT